MIKRIKTIAQEKGHVIYTEPYRLNIWGFRANTEKPNVFDDELHVFTNISQTKIAKWAYLVFKITTDPGTYWLQNPLNPKGTAILKAGQYLDAYSIDKHRNKYYALCQRLAKVTVIRDYDRDAILDFNNGKEQTGMFGINIHRARKTGSTYSVDRHSAGCQVFKNAQDFDFFMKLCEVHRKLYGNKFTYTLVDKRMEFRKTLKKITISSVLISLLLGGFYLVSND
ncbi:MAG: hypothetical protein N4A35_17630 [Flavobacteriales bacterium]|jgi:hypothetical protein|nr:hypothetical protein [Flavobacteriales bacterium]